MSEKMKKNVFGAGAAVGILFVVGGTVLLLEQLGVKLGFNVWDLWPVILIVAGIGQLTQTGTNRNYFWGTALIAVGALLLLDNLRILHFDIGSLWPLAIILVGLSILYNHFGGKARCYAGSTGTASESGSDFLNYSVVLGGGEYRITSRNLRGGRLSAVMAGIEIDLRDADMAEKEMTLAASAVMAGIELRVPENWEVELRGSPIMGSMENKSRKSGEIKCRLIVNCSPIMGSVEVKN